MIRVPSQPAHAAGVATLAAMCGGSLLVLRHAGGDFGVAALAIVKAAVAAAFLLPWLRDGARRRALARHAGALVALSLLSSTLPFALAALAAPQAGAGAMTVAHTTLPLAVVMAGAVWLGARAGRLPFAGFVAGLGGVLLLQWHSIALQFAPPPAGAPAAAPVGGALAPAALALAAASLATLCSMRGSPFVRPRLTVGDAVALAVAAQAGSALLLLAPALWLVAGADPGAAAWGHVAVLALAGAALGLALVDRLVPRAAPRQVAPGVVD